MNEVSKQDNLAINYMRRFNDHCPLIGAFSAEIPASSDFGVTFTPAGGGKGFSAKGQSIKEALDKVKTKLDPDKMKGEGDDFIGQKYAAKTVLAEK
jgi:hypothetical protein